ncbi:MAG: hypothetical protein ACYCUM_12910 [Solirubrobacteraceae bacterium]
MRGVRCALAATIALLLLPASGAASPPVSGAASLPASGAASPRVRLSVRFAPDVPGQSTTIYYGFTISEPEPLRSMELLLPAGMGFSKASLGLEECTVGALQEHGPRGCPPNSLVGFGSAYAEVPAQETVKEHANLTVLLGPSEKGRPTMLFFVEGVYPASEQLALSSQLLASAPPFGYALRTELPLLGSWPGGPYIAITHLQTTIGPHGLHYYYTEHGRRIEFEPRGLNIPERCPKGGYPVQARFRWWGIAGTASVSTRVACGSRRR